NGGDESRPRERHDEEDWPAIHGVSPKTERTLSATPTTTCAARGKSQSRELGCCCIRSLIRLLDTEEFILLRAVLTKMDKHCRLVLRQVIQAGFIDGVWLTID